MLYDLNLETIFGILSSRRIFYTKDWNGLENFIFGPPKKFHNLGANAHGVEQVSSWKKRYYGTPIASENHIRPDSTNFLTEVEIWDTLMHIGTLCRLKLPSSQFVSALNWEFCYARS